MSILNNILHPVKSLQKWALQKLFQKFINELPSGKRKLAELWEENKDEIFEKIKKAIRKTILDFFKKKMEEPQDNIYVESDN